MYFIEFGYVNNHRCVKEQLWLGSYGAILALIEPVFESLSPMQVIGGVKKASNQICSHTQKYHILCAGRGYVQTFVTRWCKVKGKVNHASQERVGGGCSSPFSRPWGP